MSFRCDSIDCENYEVPEEVHDVGQWERALNFFLRGPLHVYLRGLRHHMDEGHAEEEAGGEAV